MAKKNEPKKNEPNNNGKKKRALALAGGGPAAGLHIGVLEALEEAKIRFDVFSLSCVGAWVGIVYNTRVANAKRSRALQTFDFFAKYCFRDDASYEWFPLNRGFAMDSFAMAHALAEFLCCPGLDLSKLVPPAQEGIKSVQAWQQLFANGMPSHSQVNYWLFNDFMAIHPVVRYMISCAFKSRINGLSRIYYDDSLALAEVFQGDRLYGDDMPQIYHNAWRMAQGRQAGRIQIFHNRPDKVGKKRDYIQITPRSLCACSALPYIEESVDIDGIEYTEGALVDTVNFAPLLRDHPTIDEVWVSRIVDESQVKPARDLAGALGNLPMQFAAEVGEDDVKLFREHLMNQTMMRPRVVEIPIRKDTKVSFDWKYSNLKQGFREGYEAVKSLLAFDPELKNDLSLS